MTDITTRIEGRAGRITLTRPQALNALTHEMCLAIEAALNDWADTPEVELILLDAEGPRAFCAGGDIAQLYTSGRAADWSYGRGFWRDEYRMNALLANYAKPTVSFLQGFTMGGGVGIGCHLATRIVGESAQVAMPEVGIGLVPDVGGSKLLAEAPGAVGAYLALTAARMGPGDAIWAGFADHFLPEAEWEAAKAAMIETGRVALPAHAAPDAPLKALMPEIERHFAKPDIWAIAESLRGASGDFAEQTLKIFARNSPLSMAATHAMLRQLGTAPSIEEALRLEYRFTHRAMQHSDFIEGVRAMIIDRDRSPKWRHAGLEEVTQAEVEALLAPLGPEELSV